MSYTVFSRASAPSGATVVSSVVEALRLARDLARQGDPEPTVAADDGWFFTLDELEELAKS